MDEASGSKGKLPVNGVATHSCHFENKGTNKAVLLKVSSSCTCVAVRCEPEQVGPGEVSKITISAPVAPTAGRQDHYAIIEGTFQTPEGTELRKEQVRIAVSYEADLSFFCEPKRLLIAAQQGVEARRTVYIRSQVLDALNVRDLKISPDGIRVEKVRRLVIPAEDRPEEQALAITIVCKKDKPGLDIGALTFRTNDPAIPEFSVPIEIAIKPALITNPGGFAFIFKPGEVERKLTVGLSTRDKKDLRPDRCILVQENGLPLKHDGLQLRMVTLDSGKARIELMASSRSLAPEGVAAVDVLAADGSLLSRIPVAWVKLAASKAPSHIR